MKNQKVISSVVAFSMSLSACSPGSGGSTAGAPPSAAQEVSKLGESQSLWVKLFDSDHPNFALAELLTPWLWTLDKKNMAAIKARTQTIDPESTAASELQKSLLQMKFKMIMGDRSYIQDEVLLKNSVFSQYTRLESEGAFNLQIRLQTAAEAQAEAYKKVTAAFNEKVKANAKEISRDVVSNLNPQAISEINSTKNKDPKVAIQEIYQILKKWDKRLDAYEFAKEDEHKLLLYGYIAAELYEHLKTNSTIQDIVKGVQQIQEINKKVKEFRAVLTAMDQYQDNMAQGWKKMKDGMTGIKQDIEDNAVWNIDLKTELTEQTKKDSVAFITDLLLGKKPDGKTDGKSILSGGEKINKNAKMFFEGAGATANAVDNLISGTRVIADTLGIELDPGIEDALNTAQKITQGVKIAEQVATAFSSDGLMGAFGALAGSGGASLMLGPVGAGAMAMGQMQMNAELGKINSRLDKVIETQKEILRLQKETLAKLEDLSHKLDEYHNQQMLAIDGVKQEVLNNRKAIRDIINEKFNKCTSLVNRINSSIDMPLTTSLDAISAATTRAGLAKALANPTVRTALVSEFNTTVSFQGCGEALTNAFSHRAIANTPLSGAIYGLSHKVTPLEVKDTFYDPALKLLASTYPKKTVENMALHLPVADFSNLEKKSVYWKRNIKESANSLSAEMSEVVSVYALENYVGALLSLYPLVTISANSWTNIPSVTENAWNGTIAGGQKQNQSQFMLKSAMNTINLAIAQQSLMAGEPILPQLAEKFEDIVTEPTDCTANKSNYCFVRQNQIMAKNVLNYFLYLRVQDPAFAAAYSQAYKNSSADELYKILGPKFLGKLASQAGVKLVWLAENNVTVELPSPEALAKQLISYPPELPILVKLQEKVADELTKVTPNKLSAPEQQVLTSLVLFSYSPELQ